MVCILLLAVVCPAFCLTQTEEHSCCHHRDNASKPCGSAMHAAVPSPAVVLPVTLAPQLAVESTLSPQACCFILGLAQSKVAPTPPKVLTVLRI
jgi:hypothetical protein